MFSPFFTFAEQKSTVNTNVFGSAPTQNHGIYEVLSLCEQKSRYLQCFVARAWPKHCYLRSFLHVGKSFFWMPKAQKHCKLHDFYAWTVPKKQETWPKIDQKTPNKNLQNASSNFTLFFPTPNPQKRENPSRLKDFRGGSAAGARPRVAKAMLSFPHYTARHRRIKGLRPLPPTPGHWRVMPASAS